MSRRELDIHDHANAELICLVRDEVARMERDRVLQQPFVRVPARGPQQEPPQPDIGD